MVLWQYYRQHCTLRAFEQLETLYTHNLDDKHPTRPGFEPTTGPIEPSVSAWFIKTNPANTIDVSLVLV